MKKLKVFIKSEKNVYETSTKLLVDGHPCYGPRREVIITLPEDHERAREMAEEVAKEKGLDVEIHDLGKSFSSRMSAFLRGIKTPTIEIGDKRVNGVTSKEKLLSLLDDKGTSET